MRTYREAPSAALRRCAVTYRHAFTRTIAVALFASVGCSSGDGPTGTIKAGPPASLLLVGGEGQSGVVGQELPQAVRVKVIDADGNPVAGQIVNFRVIAGAGSVFAGAAITSDSGQATERWTLGTSPAGDQRLEARAVDPSTGAALVFGVFHATAQPDVPATITKVGGDAQQVTAGGVATDSLVARVTDRYGNPVPGVSVAWAVTSGGGTVSPAASVTNATGIAKASWTVGTSGATAQLVTASVGTLTPATFTATVTAGAAAQLALAQPAAGAAVKTAFTQQPVVRVTDAFGNLIPTSSDAVTVSVNAGASLLGTATVNAVNGVATFSGVGLDATPGTYTLTYTATLSGTARTVTQSITVTPGPGVKYVVTPSNSTPVAGSVVTISAQLTDAYGTPAPESGHTVIWVLVSGRGSFASPSSATNAAGLATVAFTVDTVAGTAATIAAAEGPSSWSTSITTVPGSATKLAFQTQPANTGFEIAMPIRVAAQDRYGNVVPATGGSVALSLGGNPAAANLGGAGPVTLSSGVATFSSVTLDQAGTGYTIVATSASGGLTPATSIPFDVSPIGIVASTTDNLYGLTIEGSSLYFTAAWQGTGLAVWRVPRSGGPAALLIDNNLVGTSVSGAGRVISDGMYIDAISIYRMTAGIWRAPLGGGTPVTVGGRDSFRGGSFGPDLEFDGTYLYVESAFGATEVIRVRASDGAQLTLTGQFASAIAVGQGELFYRNGVTAGSSIQKVSVDSGPSTTVVASVGPFSQIGWRTMLVVGTTLYWVESGANGPTDGVIRSAPTSGGIPTTIAANLSPKIRSLVSDGSYLYFSDDGSLRRLDLATGAVATIVANDGVTDIALAGQAVYWTSNGTTKAIKKAHK